MRVLALDISTKTGWALLEGDYPNILGSGTLVLPKKILEYGEYPWCYVSAAQAMAHTILAIVMQCNPDVIVIEETNKARARYTQKVLEFIHLSVLNELNDVIHKYRPGCKLQVVYVSSSAWRQKLGLALSKDEKKQNAKINKAKKQGVEALKKVKETLGVRGKVNKKHVALNFINQHFNLKLKVKHNDIADALCLGLAYIRGVAICDGK